MLRKSNVKEKTGSARSAAARGKRAPKATPSKTFASARAGSGPPAIGAEERRQMIARAAYFRAEQRGWNCGCAEQDWLEAETEIDRALRALTGATPNS